MQKLRSGGLSDAELLELVGSKNAEDDIPSDNENNDSTNSKSHYDDNENDDISFYDNSENYDN